MKKIYTFTITPAPQTNPETTQTPLFEIIEVCPVAAQTEEEAWDIVQRKRRFKNRLITLTRQS